MNRFWLTWEDHRRSRELAAVVQAQYCLISHPGNRYVRYPIQIFHTLLFLFRHKAKIIFCQNPSIVLNSLLCLVKPFFGFKLVVDRHSNFKFKYKDSLNPKWKLFHLLSRFTLGASDLTIVTNAYLKDFIEARGATGFILQDKMPVLPLAEKRPLKGKVNYVFVSTFSDDEPIEEIIGATRALSPDAHTYITGNYKKYARIEHIQSICPSNVTLTGFLSEADYQSLLMSADIIIVITDMEYTLTCGAYEAVSLGKPMVLANTETIKAYFNAGAVYADPTEESLKNAMLKAQQSLQQLAQESEELKAHLIADWNLRFEALQHQINQMG